MSEIELLDQIENQLESLSDSAYQDIKNTKKEDDLETLRVSLLGKKGKLSNILKNMNKLECNRKIYKIIGDELKNHIHSIQILIS